MITPLSVCTKEEQRSVNHFLWSEGVSKTFSAVREQCVAATECLYKWIKKNVCTNVMHEEGAGCLSTVTTDYNIERTHDMVLLDR
jgi:hypothetical protein